MDLMTDGQGHRNTARPVEPLAASAAIGWLQAPRLCYRNPETGETCEWYHRVWQYMRLLGVITSVRTNTSFLIDRFRRAAREGSSRRVLVAGTADYSMLAHLSAAYSAEGVPLEATVVDRCPTALLLNRWYADRYEIALSTACVDALMYEADQPFDVVCTHNFLARFDEAARASLVAHWHALLQPGGIVVTTQRIRPDLCGRQTSYTRDQAFSLARRIEEEARRRSEPLDVDPAELAHAVYEHAIRRYSYTIQSAEQVARLFEAAGFAIEEVDEGGGACEREQDRPSSPAGTDTYRMRIVARRC
jgi:SAM-dependent methyltransferase